MTPDEERERYIRLDHIAHLLYTASDEKLVIIERILDL